MADVELKIVMDNTGVLTGLKQMQTETQKLYQFTTQGAGKVKSVIEQEQVVLKKLNEYKKQASAEDIKYYNQAIKGSEARLKAYQNEGKGVEQLSKEYSKVGDQANNAAQKSKGFGDILKGAGQWVLGFASVTAAFQFVKSAIESTGQSADKLAEITTGVSQGFDAIKRAVATLDFKDFMKNVKDAYNEGVRYAQNLDQIDEKTRALKIEEADATRARLEAEKVQRSALSTQDEKIKAGKTIIEQEERLAKIRTQIANQAYQNEIKNISQISKLTDQEVESYLKGDEAIRNKMELGKRYIEYLNLKKQAETVNVQLTGMTGTVSQVEMLPQVKVQFEALKQEFANLTDEGIKEAERLGFAYNNIADDPKLNLAVEKYSELVSAQNSAIENTMRSSMRLDAALSKDTKNEVKSLDEGKKKVEEYAKLTKELVDKYAASNIESLSGKDKLAAQRDFGLQQIKEMRKQLAAVGTVSDEQEAMFVAMGENVWKAFFEGMRKQAKIGDIEKKLLDTEIGTLQAQLKDVKLKLNISADEVVTRQTLETLKTQFKAGEVDAGGIELVSQLETLNNQIESLLKERENIFNRAVEPISKALIGDIPAPKLAKSNIPLPDGTTEKKSLWDLMGIDPQSDEGKKAIDLVKETASQIGGILDDLYEKQVEDAQRKRELLDTQIQEANDSLNAEIELQKNGYASNVDAKKKEVDLLKIQRDKALKDEEVAIKRKRALETVEQATSLITASANILKGFSSLPFVGQILGIAAVASMVAAFVATKTKIMNSVKLEKGATGTIEGRRHYEGGERFIDNIEVEEGERWGVLSRPASARYGKTFTSMVEAMNAGKLNFKQMNDFNKESLIIQKSENKINLDTSGTNKRLHQVEREVIKLRNYFETQEQVFEGGKIIKKGIVTRKVHGI